MVFDFQPLLFIVAAAFGSNVVKAQPTSSPYEVRTCVANFVGESCLTDLLPVANPIRYQTQPVTNPNACEDTVGQRGSLSFVDITLPTNQVLYVEVTTNVVGQENVGVDNFHVRPSRLTEPWGIPTVMNNVASFYIADTGQYSVEFASSDLWKDLLSAQNFDALMLFVNPPMDPIPSDAALIEEDIAQFDNVGGGQLARTLGAGKYYFSAYEVTLEDILIRGTFNPCGQWSGPGPLNPDLDNPTPLLNPYPTATLARLSAVETDSEQRSPIPGTGTTITTLFSPNSGEEYELSPYFDYNKDYLSFPLTDIQETLYVCASSKSDYLESGNYVNRGEILASITWEEQ